MTRWLIDGQRRPREPELQLDLDDLAVDRRMAPMPEVFEHSGLQEFYLAGGWVPTTPLDLADGAG